MSLYSKADARRKLASMHLLNQSKRLVLAVAVMIASVSALAGSASAATTIGQNCNTNSGGPSVSLQRSVSSGASYVVPVNGVMTKWGINRNGQSGITIASAILGTRTAGDWTVVRRTSFELPADLVASEYPVRMQVNAGETLGLAVVNSGSVFCGGFDATTDLADYSPVGLQMNTPFTPNTANGYRVPVWASIEADIDSDGHGDDTQDQCPQSAAFQNACPVLAISQKLSADGKQISVLATASIDASLTAAARVKVGRKTVKFKSKATAFKAGKFKLVKLKLPSSVKKSLNSGKKLTATVTLSGNGLANAATATGKVKLRK